MKFDRLHPSEATELDVSALAWYSTTNTTPTTRPSAPVQQPIFDCAPMLLLWLEPLSKSPVYDGSRTTVRDRRDGVAIWINNDPEPLGKDLENAWDLVIKGPCDEVARHAALPKWNDPMDYKEITEAEMSKLKDNKKVEVVVGTPKKPSVLRNAGHLTPGQSPRMRPNTAIKEEPTTPSKKGTKRKSGAQMNLLGTIATKTQEERPEGDPSHQPRVQSFQGYFQSCWQTCSQKFRAVCSYCSDQGSPDHKQWKNRRHEQSSSSNAQTCEGYEVQANACDGATVGC
jgi:hypothetical protein